MFSNEVRRKIHEIIQNVVNELIYDNVIESSELYKINYY